MSRPFLTLLCRVTTEQPLSSLHYCKYLSARLPPPSKSAILALCMYVQKMVIVLLVSCSVFPSLSPAIFSCIMIPYLWLSGLFMISSHWIICHVLSFILSIPFPVLLMSTSLLSQVLKYFFLATELLPWLPSARPLLNSPAS